MTSDILDPSAVLSLLPSLLPPSAKELASGSDAIAALVHSALSAVGFRLIAVDDTSPGQSAATNVLPEKWKSNSPGNYTFRYRHDQSSLEFLVKLSVLGSRTLINAIALESNKVASLDISTNDFVSPPFYPYDCSASGAQPLVHGFISSSRVSDLMSQFKLQIIQKIIPGIRKDGYSEEVPIASNTNQAPASSDPQPARPTPERPFNPDRQFPYDPSSHIPPENPLQIGRRDLDPIPMNPFAPPSLFPPQGGDGMFVGPDHPIFGSRTGPRGSGRTGPWGGDGFLPPMGAPPGARFDPVGPSIGGFGNRQGREPDNDEFMPPGPGDMFS